MLSLIDVIANLISLPVITMIALNFNTSTSDNIHI